MPSSGSADSANLAIRSETVLSQTPRDDRAQAPRAARHQSDPPIRHRHAAIIPLRRPRRRSPASVDSRLDSNAMSHSAGAAHQRHEGRRQIDPSGARRLRRNWSSRRRQARVHASYCHGIPRSVTTAAPGPGTISASSHGPRGRVAGKDLCHGRARRRATGCSSRCPRSLHPAMARWLARSLILR